MADQWYKILHNQDSCDTVMKIFSNFHDYMITHIDFDYSNYVINVYFKYDTDQEGAVLKFIDVDKMNVIPLYTPDNKWISGTFLQLTKDDEFLWYVDDEKYPSDEILRSTDLLWIKSKEIHYAYLNENDEIAPLTEEKLNPVWHIYNFDTHKEEVVENHFKVDEV